MSEYLTEEEIEKWHDDYMENWTSEWDKKDMEGAPIYRDKLLECMKRLDEMLKPDASIYYSAGHDELYLHNLNQLNVLEEDLEYLYRYGATIDVSNMCFMYNL